MTDNSSETTEVLPTTEPVSPPAEEPVAAPAMEYQQPVTATHVGGTGTSKTLIVVAGGVLWFKEPVTLQRLLSAGLIIAGVSGLYLTGTGL